jgi:hypothetical protein
MFGIQMSGFLIPTVIEFIGSAEMLSNKQVPDRLALGYLISRLVWQSGYSPFLTNWMFVLIEPFNFYIGY